MSEDLIIEEIEEHKEEHIKFLRDIIQAESYNPPGNEKNVALVIERYLKNAGIKSDVFPFDDNRANLIAYLNDNFEGRNLIYNGHMDVVPPGNVEEWKNHPLSAYVKRKKIFGRGAADMKAGLAAMLISLKILKKLEVELSGNLIINAVSDEETGGKLGTGNSLKNHLESIKCDFIVIGEATGLNPLGRAIVVGEKGHLNLRVITNGISSHSMIPTMGKNAIDMMSEIIQNFNKMDEYLPEIPPPLSYEELKNLLSVVFQNTSIFEKILKEQKLLQDILYSLTNFTKSFTMIEGGIKENVIPDHCEAILDFRLLPGQTPEMIIKALKKMITENLGYEIKDEPTGGPEEVFVFIEIYNYGVGSYWDHWKDSQTVSELGAIVERIYGQKPIYFLSPGATDAHYYRNTNYCPQTVEFGPGDIRNMHATNELIETSDYINAIKVYTLFAYNFLK